MGHGIRIARELSTVPVFGVHFASNELDPFLPSELCLILDATDSIKCCQSFCPYWHNSMSSYWRFVQIHSTSQRCSIGGHWSTVMLKSLSCSSAAHQIPSLCHIILCKPCLCMKIPTGQQFLKYWDQLIWYQHYRSNGKDHSDNNSMFSSSL